MAMEMFSGAGGSIVEKAWPHFSKEMLVLPFA
jgi:hypothetical protein